MACHNLDAAVWALKLEHPQTLEATSTLSIRKSPRRFYLCFGPRGNCRGAVKWYDGGLRPDTGGNRSKYRHSSAWARAGTGIIFLAKGIITCAGRGGMPAPAAGWSGIANRQRCWVASSVLRMLQLQAPTPAASKL